MPSGVLPEWKRAYRSELGEPVAVVGVVERERSHGWQRLLL